MIKLIQKRLQEKAEGTDKGFTLVELLVVIIIIGILAAIAIPLYLNQQNKAKDSAAKADLNSVRTAVVSAITENPAATAVSWAETAGGSAATITTTGGSGDTYEVGISEGNTLEAGGVDMADPDDVEISIESGTGTTFTIDANGNIDEAAATGSEG